MSVLTQFDLRAAIDILIVAYILYRVLLLIRGTRAVRVAVGLVVLSVFYGLANLFNLKTVDWALSNIFTYFVFAVIVLFQSELRRGLAILGRTPFFRDLTKSIQSEPFEDVISAATAMAAERRGAIFVFERTVGLRNYIDQGIQLDALISYDLLFSIFHTETPLHDGAVIIQGDRLAAASCFLPLTTNPRLSREMGSRHRAAIGISEETDAVALVVSEETGTISIAVDGRVTRRMDAATLRRRLRDLLVVASPAGAQAGSTSGDESPAAVGEASRSGDAVPPAAPGR